MSSVLNKNFEKIYIKKSWRGYNLKRVVKAKRWYLNLNKSISCKPSSYNYSYRELGVVTKFLVGNLLLPCDFNDATKEP